MLNNSYLRRVCERFFVCVGETDRLEFDAVVVGSNLEIRDFGSLSRDFANVQIAEKETFII